MHKILILSRKYAIVANLLKVKKQVDYISTKSSNIIGADASGELK